MSTTPPWMLVRLALETAVHHATADEDRLEALGLKNLCEYRAFLMRVYGFEFPVELALSRVNCIDGSLLRGRTSRLRQDLIALDVRSEDIARLPMASVQIRNVAEALGWLFVLERQTLLAGQLVRQLSRTLGPAIKEATTYLTACGDSPGMRFRMFGEVLSDFAHSYPPKQIVGAANEAFRAQRQWYMAAKHDTYLDIIADAAVA